MFPEYPRRHKAPFGRKPPELPDTLMGKAVVVVTAMVTIAFLLTSLYLAGLVLDAICQLAVH